MPASSTLALSELSDKSTQTSSSPSMAISLPRMPSLSISPQAPTWYISPLLLPPPALWIEFTLIDWHQTSPSRKLLSLGTPTSKNGFGMLERYGDSGYLSRDGLSVRGCKGARKGPSTRERDRGLDFWASGIDDGQMEADQFLNNLETIILRQLGYDLEMIVFWHGGEKWEVGNIRLEVVSLKTWRQISLPKDHRMNLVLNQAQVFTDKFDFTGSQKSLILDTWTYWQRFYSEDIVILIRNQEIILIKLTGDFRVPKRSFDERSVEDSGLTWLSKLRLYLLNFVTPVSTIGMSLKISIKSL